MDISIILKQGGYNIGEHYQMKGVWGVDNWNEVLTWYHPTDSYPSEEEVLIWQAEILDEKSSQQQQFLTNYTLLLSWGQRANTILQSASYFKETSDILWNAIEQGKPTLDSKEIDSLHLSFEQKMSENSFWEDSHNYMREFLDVVINTNNPLNATHGTKCLDLIGWYLFNAVAANVVAQALQLSLNKK